MHSNYFWIDGVWQGNEARNDFDEIVLACIDAVEQNTGQTGNDMTAIEREVRKAVMGAMHATAKKTAKQIVK